MPNEDQIPKRWTDPHKRQRFIYYDGPGSKLARGMCVIPVGDQYAMMTLTDAAKTKLKKSQSSMMVVNAEDFPEIERYLDEAVGRPRPTKN